ncbi:MAG: hypothetical protein Q4C85_07365 [Actinomyces sp.]|uniref:hypothetical protein n=1 Tax=Actinomyces sp. TaxID=29317 RepID=UPI0026DB1908|nr:hypothetical protein [Actinomyces sp.]MDO4243562.1 hypothetical protein [Actinomyces sp.]
MIESVDFTTLWSSFLTTVESVADTAGLFTILAYVGLGILIAAIVRWFWQKRRGGRIAEGNSAVFWALVVGLLCISPKVVIPIALLILQILANLCIAVLNQTGLGV